jgi:hydrogenase maturation protease
MTRPRILIAGIGNIFLGDDAFGVEVARRLSRQELPNEVKVVDFGIRGLDLAYSLLDGHDAVILVDAAPRGGPAGTLYVLELSPPDNAHAEGRDGISIDTHNLDPAKVLRMVSMMGGKLDRILLVGCEPSPLGESEEMRLAMSEPVRAAVDQAIPLIMSLTNRLLTGGEIETSEDDS